MIPFEMYLDVKEKAFCGGQAGNSPFQAFRTGMPSLKHPDVEADAIEKEAGWRNP
jgi:hypothetical protein